MKSLVLAVLLIMANEITNAADLIPIKSDKTCFTYAVSRKQLEVPFNAFCFDSKKLYIYDKFSLRGADTLKSPTRTESIVKIYKNLPTEGVEPELNAADLEAGAALFILTDKGSMIFINKYNFESEGELSFFDPTNKSNESAKYQYDRYFDLDYISK
jgi:hypothetical protein